ncbi:farnesyl pyrophosphate synthase-like [Ostrinia furnacalis]|uniref:farnesyl pyrophosphate synthase-like n=1 Tax=Ostrinia furnacalis TaxID=93504 RepID=UPI00103A3629|nr:farnesyl pyrophosphate synthase-like [Ostrinia furnacalis]
MLNSFEMIENPENITAETINQAFVLAWAAQITEAHQKISEEAKLGPTASKQNHSEVAVKDGNLLRSFMYAMLEQKFQNTKKYRDILQLFNKAFLYGVISQYQDNPINKTNKCANINSSYYQMLCDYKVSYIYFELPLLLAMKLSNKTDVNLQENVHNICSQMGMLYQIQEDFQNCFGDETIIGTEGTDIQEGKCTWLAVTALQRFTPHQRVVFEACYGSDEPAHIERVKLLYKQMQLDQLLREEEGALYESIMQNSEMVEKSGIPCKLFENLLEAIRNPS